MSPILRLCNEHGLYEPGNPSIPRGRCPQCYKLDNRRRHQKAKRGGTKTLYWQQVRADRLALDCGLCTFQLPGCTHQAETVHLAPELRGNHRLATVDNTRSACRHCHGIIDAPRAQPRGRV